MLASKQDKRVAIMQPYLFPYIGYFQLLDSIDEFWVFDCVQYIRRGWMNRNRILLNGVDSRFAISVERGSREQCVFEKRYSVSALDDCSRLVKSLMLSGSPNRKSAIWLVEGLKQRLSDVSMERSFAKITASTLLDTCALFGIRPSVRFSSELSVPASYRGQQRVLEICRRINASRYVNLPSGAGLYDPKAFSDEGIDLLFVQPAFREYPQVKVQSFVPMLSVLDLIASVSERELCSFIEGYSLTDGKI